MAHPKRRKSRSKKRMHRSHHALLRPSLSICPNCSERMISHRICTSCGYYNGRQVIAYEEES
ncbi:TPA: 50S ribosomal protein L32 [Candidatus Poribacteria bacterium]|nr:50S ribosomal protein L32 [Candidatus Poribacteria bacterium]